MGQPRVSNSLALNAIILQAQVDLELRGLKADLDAISEEAFHDTDFELLVDRKFDGIEDSEMAECSGMTNLWFEDWFTPFANVPDVHPDVAETPARPRGRRL